MAIFAADAADVTIGAAKDAVDTAKDAVNAANIYLAFQKKNIFEKFGTVGKTNIDTSSQFVDKISPFVDFIFYLRFVRLSLQRYIIKFESS